jgi:glycolate oxidase
MDMPRPDPVVLSNRARVLARLRAVLPADAVIEDEAENPRL